MMINLKVVRLRDALHGLCELSDANHLIVHSGQSLVAVAWPDLRNASDGVTFSLGPSGYGKVVATNLAVDNAWIVEPKTQRVLVARQGEIDSIDPSGRLAAQRVTVTGLPGGAFAAAVDPEGRHVLLTVLRIVNPDFANYAVAMVDLTNGRLVREQAIGSGADLELLWDGRLGTWVVGDTSRGAMWRWDGAGRAVRLTGPTDGPIHAATFEATNEGVIVSALFTKSGTTGLVSGLAEQDRVNWTPAVMLPGLPVLMARRDPSAVRWACLAQAGAGQQVQIRDATGKVLAQAGMRPAAHIEKLQWSVSAPDRLWGFGIHAIAAITLSDRSDDAHSRLLDES